MLNGDEYTMLLKEEYFNPKLSDATSDIPELNYNPSFSEYEMYNNNTDWLKAVKQAAEPLACADGRRRESEIPYRGRI
jgi:hypothetical protein